MLAPFDRSHNDLLLVFHWYYILPFPSHSHLFTKWERDTWCGWVGIHCHVLAQCQLHKCMNPVWYKCGISISLTLIFHCLIVWYLCMKNIRQLSSRYPHDVLVSHPLCCTQIPFEKACSRWMLKDTQGQWNCCYHFLLMACSNSILFLHHFQGITTFVVYSLCMQLPVTFTSF